MSNAFMDVFTPLNSLVRVAEEGDRTHIQEVAKTFEEHANTMLKVQGAMA